MIKVYNRIIPWRGFKLMTLWPFLFIKKGAKIKDTDINHECIHLRQQTELFVFLFYVLYILFFVIEMVRCAFDKNRMQTIKGKNRNIYQRAYRGVLFEREAYWFQDDPEYLKHRKLFAWARM